MAVLADRGVDLPASSNGPVLRMVDQEIVRGEFYAQTVSEGTSEQKAEHRRKQFNRALDWAEKQELISVREIGGITYLWLARPSHTGKEEDF
jgi:hypothetical protein